MMKMHLVARVPNEGARRLAWWIGRECKGNLGAAAWRLFVDAAQLERLLDGTMVPGTVLLADLIPRTDGAMTRPDWYRDPAGGWFDEPVSRAGARAA
jgi:hypothetical protein